MPHTDPEKKRTYHRSYKSRWRKQNLEREREKERARNHKYRAAHPEVKERKRLWAKKYRQTDMARDKWLRRNYGISLGDYDAMIAAQGGRCALCDASRPGSTGKHWHVDHDHETGRVRGLLCFVCNSSRLGANDLYSARAVVRYLDPNRDAPLLGSELVEDA